MSAIPLALRQNTPEWEDARRDYIGSSDIPSITGNRVGGLLKLWSIKTRLLEPEPVDPETQELFDLGHALEPVIATRYTIKTGRPVRVVNRMLQHPSIPWATASLDRVSAVRGERRVIELKWAPFSRDWTGDEPVPAMVQDQVQWQLMVTGYPVADVAVLRNGKVEIHELESDHGYQDDLLFLARDFRGYVERREQPPVDGSEETARVLTRLHPYATEALIEPTAETDALAADLREAIAALKAAKERDGRLRNTLRTVLEGAEGVKSDAYRITWTNNKDSHPVEWELVAKAYRSHLLSGDEPPPDMTGKQFCDAIEALYTQTVEGSRVLRPKFKDEESGKWS